MKIPKDKAARIGQQLIVPLRQLINSAVEWLAKNDSYAVPTNVQVDRLREHLNNKMKGE